jgi:hypothetical protein
MDKGCEGLEGGKVKSRGTRETWNLRGAREGWNLRGTGGKVKIERNRGNMEIKRDRGEMEFKSWRKMEFERNMGDDASEPCIPSR